MPESLENLFLVAPHPKMHEEYRLTKEEINAIVQEGVKQAFRNIGLGDDSARKDVTELRELIAAYRSAKHTIWNTVWTVITTVMVTALLFWFGINKLS